MFINIITLELFTSLLYFNQYCQLLAYECVTAKEDAIESLYYKRKLSIKEVTAVFLQFFSTENIANEKF